MKLPSSVPLSGREKPDTLLHIGAILDVLKKERQPMTISDLARKLRGIRELQGWPRGKSSLDYYLVGFHDKKRNITKDFGGWLKGAVEKSYKRLGYMDETTVKNITLAAVSLKPAVLRELGSYRASVSCLPSLTVGVAPQSSVIGSLRK